MARSRLNAVDRAGLPRSADGPLEPGYLNNFPQFIFNKGLKAFAYMQLRHQRIPGLFQVPKSSAVQGPRHAEMATAKSFFLHDWNSPDKFLDPHSGDTL